MGTVSAKMTIMVTYKQEGEGVKMLVYNFTNPNGAIPPKIYNSQLCRMAQIYAKMKKTVENNGGSLDTPDSDQELEIGEEGQAEGEVEMDAQPEAVDVE